MARRRSPAPRRAATGRAARPARPQGVDRADRVAPLAQAGGRRVGGPRGSTSATSSTPGRTRPWRPRARADRVGAGDQCGPARSGCSEKTPTRLLPPLRGVARPGTWRSTSRASASHTAHLLEAPLRDRLAWTLDAARGRSGRGRARSETWTVRATSPTSENGTSGGERAQCASLVGVLEVRPPPPDGHGLKSMLPRFAAQTRCAASTGAFSVALRPDGKWCRHSRLP